jgi:hypothetical protein
MRHGLDGPIDLLGAAQAAGQISHSLPFALILHLPDLLTIPVRCPGGNRSERGARVCHLALIDQHPQYRCLLCQRRLTI